LERLTLVEAGLPRTAKSQEFFRLTALCHIAIRVEMYRAQNGFTQCRMFQQVGHCQFAEGEKAHPANYRGCRHAKEELQKRKSQRTPKTTTGRVFSLNLTTLSISFAAALRGAQ
jgi:hypothetical protein